MEEDRASYENIRTWFLSCYYIYCKSKTHYNSQWEEQEYEVGYAYEEFSNAFELPLEKLMLEVLTLILYAGRESFQVREYHNKIISDIIENNDLYKMLNELPQEERDTLRSDLKILGFI